MLGSVSGIGLFFCLGSVVGWGECTMSRFGGCLMHRAVCYSTKLILTSPTFTKSRFFTRQVKHHHHQDETRQNYEGMYRMPADETEVCVPQG